MRLKNIFKTAMLIPLMPIIGAGGIGASSSAGSAEVELTPTQNDSAAVLDGGDQSPSDTGKPEKTFTQAEVNALMAKEKDQGRKTILKELGVSDVKNAKEALDRYKEFLESQKTDLQKAQDAAAETEKNRKLLEEELTNTNQKFAVLMAGCAPDKLDDVCVLARARMNDKTTFEQAVEQVRQGYPEMFNQQSQSKGTGSNTNPQNKKMAQSNGSFGQRLAMQHKSETTNPYFNS